MCLMLQHIYYQDTVWRREGGGMFLVLQHIHYQDTVWRREGGMCLMLQHIHYQDTVWRREGGRNVPDAAAHTLPGHCVEEREREECA